MNKYINRWEAFSNQSPLKLDLISKTKVAIIEYGVCSKSRQVVRFVVLLSFRFVTTRRQSYNRKMMFWSVSSVSLLAKISLVPKEWAVNLRVPAFWQWSGINEVNFLGFRGFLEYLISWFIGFSSWSTPFLHSLNNEKAFRPALDKKNFKDCTEQESLPVAYIHLSFASSLVSSKPLGAFLCVSWLIVTFSIPFSSFFHNFKDLIYNWW